MKTKPKPIIVIFLIQNVSKLTSQNGNIAITSNSDLTLQSSYIQALNNVSLTSNNGSVNLTQNSSTANYQKTLSGDNGKGSVNDYSRQTVSNIIETGNINTTGNNSNNNNPNNLNNPNNPKSEHCFN